MIKNIPEAPPELLALLATSQHPAANSNRPPSGIMQPGSRNNELASQAGWFRRKGYSEDQIASQLHLTNNMAASPLPEDEVDSIAKSIARYESAAPVEVDDIPLARRIALEVAPTVCRTGATGWMRYDGSRWVIDFGASHVTEKVKCVLEGLSAQLAASGDRTALKTAGQLLSASKVKRMVELIATDPQIVKSFEDFDQAPREMNLPNGTLFLETRKLQSHSNADNFTKISNVEYEESAKCPIFDDFLATCMAPEEAAFVLRLFGYALLGEPKRQVFAIFHGPGRNGKSTLVEVISHIMGDYACSAEPSSFIKQKTTGVRNDLARLKGARMVATSELSTGEILDAALVKRITGGDTIAARALYKEHFEFRAEFVMFMVTNNLPVIDGGDTALARRLILVPFENTIPASECDPELSAKLRAEAKGIFNRLLDGCADYLEGGLQVPSTLMSAADRYVEGSDLIQAFLDDCCVLGADQQASASALYRSYQRWSERSGTKPYANPTFRAEITKRTNRSQKRTSKGKVWPGVGLRQLPPQV